MSADVLPANCDAVTLVLILAVRVIDSLSRKHTMLQVYSKIYMCNPSYTYGYDDLVRDVGASWVLRFGVLHVLVGPPPGVGEQVACIQENST